MADVYDPQWTPNPYCNSKSEAKQRALLCLASDLVAACEANCFFEETTTAFREAEKAEAASAALAEPNICVHCGEEKPTPHVLVLADEPYCDQCWGAIIDCGYAEEGGDENA